MPDIAILLRDLSGGGAERVMLNLAEGFTKIRLNVDLILVESVGEYVSQIPSEINLVSLKETRLLSSLPKLINYLKSSKPKVLISALEDTNIVSLITSKIAGGSIKTIVTVHNNLSSESKNSHQLKRRLTPKLVRLFYPLANHIVAVSQGVANDLVRIGLAPDRISAIYNPIVTSDLYKKANEHLSHPWFQPGQPPVILGAGRLTRQKDFPTLIHAFSKYRQDHMSRLVILGEGEERHSLEELARDLKVDDDISFVGFVENPYTYMAKSSVVVLSSAWEGFGNVLVEAMAVGTPVISTDCPSGPSEILDYGKYGQMVPVSDVEQLVLAICETLKQPISSEVLRKRATDFSLERALEQYGRLL